MLLGEPMDIFVQRWYAAVEPLSVVKRGVKRSLFKHAELYAEPVLGHL